MGNFKLVYKINARLNILCFRCQATRSAGHHRAHVASERRTPPQLEDLRAFVLALQSRRFFQNCSKKNFFYSRKQITSIRKGHLCVHESLKKLNNTFIHRSRASYERVKVAIWFGAASGIDNDNE